MFKSTVACKTCTRMSQIARQSVARAARAPHEQQDQLLRQFGLLPLYALSAALPIAGSDRDHAIVRDFPRSLLRCVLAVAAAATAAAPPENLLPVELLLRKAPLTFTKHVQGERRGQY